MNKAVMSAIFSVLGSVSACASPERDTKISVRSLYQSAYCAEQRPGLRWLNPEELADMMSSGPVQHLGAPRPEIPEMAPDERLLLVNLGTKPSGGYGIALDGTSGEIKQGVLQLPVSLQTPQEGSMQTQQITSPCLVMAVSEGSYGEVSVGGLGSVGR